MKKIILFCSLLFAASVAAQVCDVTYTVQAETADGYDVGVASSTLMAMPMADVLDNHAKQLKVLDVASRQQDKGGPYSIEVGEYRACDGGAKVKISDGSALLLGVTLKGANTIGREALKQADLILKRYEQRAAKGEKQGWDHVKALKVKRDDLGKRVSDGGK